MIMYKAQVYHLIFVLRLNFMPSHAQDCSLQSLGHRSGVQQQASTLKVLDFFNQLDFS